MKRQSCNDRRTPTSCRTPLSLGIASAIFVALTVPGRAEQSEVEALRAQVAELAAKFTEVNTRLQQLEAKEKAAATAAVEAAKAGPTVTSREKVVVSGLMQVQGLSYFGQENAFPKRADTFRLRRGELRITAPAITSRISGTVMFDPAKVISANGNNINIRPRDNVLQEIQISYLVKKDGNDNHYVDIGQYKIPVGYESLQSSSTIPTVERALLFSQRDPAGSDSGYGDVRDSGIQLRGTFSKLIRWGTLDYRFGIFNGLGDRQDTIAATDPKAVLGWLAFKPRALDGLQVGVSGGGGNTALGPAGNRFSRGLFNLFGVYKKEKLTLQSEYIQGHSQLRGGAASSDIAGYYAHVGYLFHPKIEGVLRYDSLDTNRNVNNADANDVTVGVNYFLKGNNAKIQANIVRHHGAANSPVPDLRPDRTELRTNFQVAF